MNKDLQVMSLKQLVNNKKIYDSFLEELETQIQMYQRSLEQADHDVLVYRLQGNIASLRRLTKLREQVNGSN